MSFGPLPEGEGAVVLLIGLTRSRPLVPRRILDPSRDRGPVVLFIKTSPQNVTTILDYPFSLHCKPKVCILVCVANYVADLWVQPVRGRHDMQRSDGEMAALTPEESWGAIHETVDRVRSSMYVAGTATILLLWGAIASIGYLSEYAIGTLAPGFAESSPLISAPLWGVLCAIGMAGSSIIGKRAGSENAVGDAARSAGIRVFVFWAAVVAAAFLVPAAAGMWNADDGANIPRVAIGIVALGTSCSA